MTEFPVLAHTPDDNDPGSYTILDIEPRALEDGATPSLAGIDVMPPYPVDVEPRWATLTEVQKEVRQAVIDALTVGDDARPVKVVPPKSFRTRVFNPRANIPVLAMPVQAYRHSTYILNRDVANPIYFGSSGANAQAEGFPLIVAAPWFRIDASESELWLWSPVDMGPVHVLSQQYAGNL